MNETEESFQFWNLKSKSALFAALLTILRAIDTFSTPGEYSSSAELFGGILGMFVGFIILFGLFRWLYKIFIFDRSGPSETESVESVN